MKTYTIKPLEWSSGKVEEIGDRIGATTMLGNYVIWISWNGRLRWRFRDESDLCSTVEEGKAAAEAHWQDRITKALTEVPNV